MFPEYSTDLRYPVKSAMFFTITLKLRELLRYSTNFGDAPQGESYGLRKRTETIVHAELRAVLR